MIGGTAGEGIWPFESTATVAADTFSHVAVTRKGADFTLYLNGKPVARTKASAPIHHRNIESVKVGTIFDTGGSAGNLFDGVIDDLRVYNRPLGKKEVQQLAAAVEPTPSTRPIAWRWSPEDVKAEWTTVEIDIAPFCDDATQYLVEFKKTGGADALEIQSIVPLFDGREAPEFIERVGQSDKFYVTIPSLGIPLELRAVLRGTDSMGEVLITKRP